MKIYITYKLSILFNQCALVFILLLVSITGYTQLQIEKTIIDFGYITNETERFQDIKITNVGSKKEYILNYQTPKEITCLFNTQAALKDSTLIFRIQPNPKKKGPFSYEIVVYTSDKLEPTILKVKGNLQEYLDDPLSNLQACPTFKDRPSVHATDFKLNITTKDKNTGELLSETSILLLQNGLEIAKLKTNQFGVVTKKVPLGFTYFSAIKPGYFPAEMGAYVNFKSNDIIIYLLKDSLFNHLKNKEVNIDNKIVETTKIVNKSKIDSSFTFIPKLDEIGVQKLVTISLDSLPLTQFDSDLFKPLNITFVIDISSSMKIGDRMELMKYALHQLSSILRKEDQLSIVSYATEAEVLLNTIEGNKKDEMKAAIAAIKAGGMTAGGEGIKLGCKLNAKSFRKESENIVYIITDGAFNKASKAYIESIQKYKDMGIRVSVIGIQNTPHDAVNMQNIADLGGGHYISIQHLVDAENALIKEVRKECYIKK